MIGMALYSLGHRWRCSRRLAATAAAALSSTATLVGAMQLELDDRIVVARTPSVRRQLGGRARNLGQDHAG